MRRPSRTRISTKTVRLTIIGGAMAVGLLGGGRRSEAMTLFDMVCSLDPDCTCEVFVIPEICYPDPAIPCVPPNEIVIDGYHVPS